MLTLLQTLLKIKKLKKRKEERRNPKLIKIKKMMMKKKKIQMKNLQKETIFIKKYLISQIKKSKRLSFKIIQLSVF
jgi:hypothetical protein